MLVYLCAIFLDLPTPAGTQYTQNLPPTELMKWGVSSSPGQPAAHWWYKVQGLRGWSNNPEGWEWPKIEPAPLARWLFLLGLGTLGALALWWLERQGNLGRNATIILDLSFLILFSCVLQIGTLWLKSPDPEQLLGDRILDNSFSGYLSSALQLRDPAALFSKYDATLSSPAYCAHCRTHPPGPVAFYWLLLRGVERLPSGWQAQIGQIVMDTMVLSPSNLLPQIAIVTALAGALILLAAASIVIPVYGLARRLGDVRSAIPLAALGAVLPGLVLMSPEFDQLYAALSAWLFYVSVRGMSRLERNEWWGMAAGLLLAFSLYWSLAFASLAIALGILALAAMLEDFGNSTQTAFEQLPLRGWLKWLLGFGLGLVIPWTVLGVFGFNIPHVLKDIAWEHLEGVTAVRPYFPWLIFNMVDYLQFLGLPLALTTLFVLRPSRTAQLLVPHANYKRKIFARVQDWIVRFGTSVNIYALAFWITLLGVDISGTTRGEVGRLWLFLMPLALLPIFSAVGQGQLKLGHIHALLGAQFVICIVIGGNWMTP